jgi:hypothetical protein
MEKRMKYFCKNNQVKKRGKDTYIVCGKMFETYKKLMKNGYNTT